MARAEAGGEVLSAGSIPYFHHLSKLGRFATPVSPCIYRVWDDLQDGLLWRVNDRLDDRVDDQKELLELNERPVIKPAEEKFYPASETCAGASRSSRGNTEPPGRHEGRLYSRLAYTALNSPDVGAVEVGFFGELILRETTFAADSSDVSAKRSESSVPTGHRVHDARYDACSSVDYRLQCGASGEVESLVR